MTIRVERVNWNDPLFGQVARLRYDVYAGEERQELADMDHQLRTLSDALDREAYVNAAIDENRVVGTVRLTPFRVLPDGDAARQHLRSTGFPMDDSQAFHVGRLIVSPSHRGGAASALLFAQTYRDALALGFEVAYAECNPRNLPLYESVGWRVSGPAYFDPLYGLNVRLVLVLRDYTHLQAARSPFLADRDEGRADAALAAWTAREVATTSTPSSLRLRSAAFQHAFHEDLKTLPGSFAIGLTDDELKRVLRSATTFDLSEGTQILQDGCWSTETFLVLDGDVALNETTGTQMVGRGEVFNATALLSIRSPQSKINARCATRVRLMALSAESFKGLRTSDPVLARAVARRFSEVAGHQIEHIASSSEQI